MRFQETLVHLSSREFGTRFYINLT